MNDAITILEDQIKKIDLMIEENQELIYKHSNIIKTLEIQNEHFLERSNNILDAIAQLALNNLIYD